MELYGKNLSRTGQETQRIAARQEEITAASHIHKGSQTGNRDFLSGSLNCEPQIVFGNVRPAAPRQIRMNALPCNRVNFITKAMEFGRSDPGLLHEFKLAVEVCIQADKKRAFFVPVDKGPSAPQNAMAVGDSSGGYGTQTGSRDLADHLCRTEIHYRGG